MDKNEFVKLGIVEGEDEDNKIETSSDELAKAASTVIKNLNDE